MSQTAENNGYLVAALYKFVSVEDPARLKQPIEELCTDFELKGILLLAHEGINGTIAGQSQNVQAFLSELQKFSEFLDVEHKESFAEKMPFLRMKVRLKAEIVTMGVEDLNPSKDAGEYVLPENWNLLIADPNTVVIDTRNDYEVMLGTFEGAINPKTDSFGEFPAWVKENTELLDKPNVAMFCTGGIRCEKSTAYLKQQGYENVYHLKGGILKYLEEVPESESLWSGDCFVFDQRVSVGHGLVEGNHFLCFGCRMPLFPEDLKHQDYEEGVHCHHCLHSRSQKEHERARARHNQVQLAKQRNTKHLGS